MKKSLSLFVLLLLASASVWAQGTLSAISPSSMQPGYSGMVTVTGTGTNFSIATAGINLRLTHVGSGQIFNFGTAPGGAAWSPGYIGMPAATAAGNITLPGNAPVGTYNVTVLGFSGNTWMQNVNTTGNSLLTVAVPPNVGYFTGKVVLETDSNCVQSVGEEGLTNRLIYANPGGYLTATDANGNYSLPLPLGTYTISTLTAGTSIVCPGSPYTLNATVNTSGGTASGLNFFMKSNHTLDLSTALIIGIHRPGFSNNGWWVQASNNTPTPAPNTVLKLAKPSNITFNTFTIPPTSIVGDTAYWNLGTLAGNSSVTIAGTSLVPINTLGQAFTYHSNVTTTGVDTSPFNNPQTSTNTIQGSYDPNDKQVWVANTGANADGLVLPTDSLFRYLIRFQNTGTDTAFNIIVRDTFDTDLDMSTLVVTGSSHPYTLQIPDSTGRRLAFAFNNILLLDSFANEPASHGWIQYQIRKKNGLANGTVLSNRASIYFDFNLPVLTNTVNTTICPSLGTAFTYTSNALVANLHGPTTGSATGWAWNFGDGQTGTGANPVHTYANAGTYNVCVTVTNACGRSQQLCQSVTVGCAAINAGFTSNQTAGYTVNFTNGSTGTISGYAWNFGDGFSSNATNPTHTYALPGTYNVCLVITNTCADHDTICHTVTVTCPAMHAGFMYTVTGNHVTFNNQSTGSYASVTWLFGDGGTTAAPNPQYNYLAPGLYNVCLILTNACGTHDTSCVAISVGCTALGASFGMSNTLNTYNFSDLSAGTNLSYAWDFGDGGTSTQASPTHTYYTVGSFQACLTVTDACQSSAARCSTVVISCVTPQTAFSSTASNLTVYFTDLSSNNPTTWAWDFGDGGTSTVASPVHTFPAPGVYAVCLTAGNACGPDTRCDSMNVVAVGVTPRQDLQVSLAPNPASDRVQLQLTQAQLQDVQFKLLDAMGRLVEQWNVAMIAGDYAHELDLSAKAEGVYFLRIQTQGLQRTLRLVVQR